MLSRIEMRNSVDVRGFARRASLAPRSGERVPKAGEGRAGASDLHGHALYRVALFTARFLTCYMIKAESGTAPSAPHPACRPPSPRKRGEGKAEAEVSCSGINARFEAARPCAFQKCAGPSVMATLVSRPSLFSKVHVISGRKTRFDSGRIHGFLEQGAGAMAGIGEVEFNGHGVSLCSDGQPNSRISAPSGWWVRAMQ